MDHGGTVGRCLVPGVLYVRVEGHCPCPGCFARLDLYDREHAVTAIAEVFAALHADCLVDEATADTIRRLFPTQK